MPDTIAAPRGAGDEAATASRRFQPSSPTRSTADGLLACGEWTAHPMGHATTRKHALAPVMERSRKGSCVAPQAHGSGFSTTPFSSICFAWRIPLGVLSIFVEMPADGADRRAEIEIKNKLAHVRRTPWGRQWLVAPRRGIAVDPRAGHAGARAPPRSQCDRPWRRGLRHAQRPRAHPPRHADAPRQSGRARLPTVTTSAARAARRGCAGRCRADLGARGRGARLAPR